MHLSPRAPEGRSRRRSRTAVSARGDADGGERTTPETREDAVELQTGRASGQRPKKGTARGGEASRRVVRAAPRRRGVARARASDPTNYPSASAVLPPPPLAPLSYRSLPTACDRGSRSPYEDEWRACVADAQRPLRSKLHAEAGLRMSDRALWGTLSKAGWPLAAEEEREGGGAVCGRGAEGVGGRLRARRPCEGGPARVVDGVNPRTAARNRGRENARRQRTPGIVQRGKRAGRHV